MKSNNIQKRCSGRRRRLRVGAVASILLASASLVLSIHHQPIALIPTNIHSQTSRPTLPLPLPLNALSRYDRVRGGVSNPLVCYYANEWIDTDIDLALHTGKAPASIAKPAKPPSQTKTSPAASLLRKQKRRLSRKLHRLKEIVRTRITEKCTVYVLECRDGKYYVGSTANRERRLQEHAHGRGSKWTRIHAPLGVQREYRRVPSRFLLGMESKVTAECMLEFGVNNVRGSMFCRQGEYHNGDIELLTKFLGHYNNLSYKKVHSTLMKTLPISPKQVKKRNNYNKHMSGRCYHCKKHGHFAADCPERNEMMLKRRLLPKNNDALTSNLAP